MEIRQWQDKPLAIKEIESARSKEEEMLSTRTVVEITRANPAPFW
jgi:hypothetical protein